MKNNTSKKAGSKKNNIETNPLEFSPQSMVGIDVSDEEIVEILTQEIW